MTFARQYCQLIHKLNQSPIPAPAALILERGTEGTVRRRCRWRGTQGACYANAQYLASRRKGLRYAEGFATSVIPVEHAWCVDAEGRVIDPTWDYEYQPDYFGVIFEADHVRRIRQITGPKAYSLLFTWWKWAEIYPLL